MRGTNELIDKIERNDAYRYKIRRTESCFGLGDETITLCSYNVWDTNTNCFIDYSPREPRSIDCAYERVMQFNHDDLIYLSIIAMDL